MNGSVKVRRLDPDQERAVNASERRVLVNSIAGSGKTTVIVERVKKLLRDGVQGDRILLLTFTNKAASEMIERIQRELKSAADGIFGGTFHSWCNIQLRKYAKYVGYESNFLILDSEDQKDRIRVIRNDYLTENLTKLLERAKVDKTKEAEKKFNSQFPKTSTIATMIQKSKLSRVSFAEINFNEDMGISDVVLDATKEIATVYQRSLRENNEMDFTELLIQGRNLLADKTTAIETHLGILTVGEWIAKSYDHILVDEYQDVNTLQYDIVELVSRYANMFVVGDPRQSIYGFRGADIKFIQKYCDKHKGAKEYPLRYNYRSQANIIRFSENAIQQWKEMKTNMTPVVDASYPVEVFVGEHDGRQFYHIANKIQQMREWDKTLSLNECAVLLRGTKANYVGMLEIAFKKVGIPYKIVSGLEFFSRKHIRDVMAALKVVYMPKDKIALYRYMELFPGLGVKRVDRFWRSYQYYEFDLDLLTESEDEGFIRVELANRMLGKGKVPEGLAKSIYLLKKMRKKGTLQEAAKCFVDEFYYEQKVAGEVKASQMLEQIEGLYGTLAAYSDFEKMLADLALENKNDDTADGVVTICTMHKSKGLEWDWVFLPKIEEDILPHQKSQNEDELLDERRLFYVACTRARKGLCITTTGYYNDGSKLPIEASRFLHEIKPELYKITSKKYHKKSA